MTPSELQKAAEDGTWLVWEHSRADEPSPMLVKALGFSFTHGYCCVNEHGGPGQFFRANPDYLRPATPQDFLTMGEE